MNLRIFLSIKPATVRSWEVSLEVNKWSNYYSIILYLCIKYDNFEVESKILSRTYDLAVLSGLGSGKIGEADRWAINPN